MVNEHIVNYHPSPSEFTSSIHPLIFLWTPKGLISPEYFLNFFSNLYIPPGLQKSFKFMVLRLLENTFVSQNTGKYICESKYWICLLMAQNKTLPQVFIITTTGRRKLLISPNQNVLKIYFSSAERGRTIELKIWPKLNLQGYWSQVLINSTICNLYSFGFCFAVT